jgi:hypothetical protein
MAPNAHLMLHRAWGVCIGNTADHSDQANVLSKVDQALALTYAMRSGRSEGEMLRYMEKETWLNADEALELGLATEKFEQLAPVASFDLSIYANVPAKLKRRPSPETLAARNPSELRKILVERAGMTHSAADKITAGGWPALRASDNHHDLEKLTASFGRVAAELRNGDQI